METQIKDIDIERLPQHVAIIMDGNGRWAQKNGMNRYQGHREGVVSIRKVVEAASQIGIKYLTVYTFSTENWNRPTEEINTLMDLMVTAIQQETDNLMAKNIRLQTIGDIKSLPEATRNSLNTCIEKTAQNNGLTLIVAISYSSRWEIIEVTRNIVHEIQKGQLTIDGINEKIFSSCLATRNIPDPDLLIRTGGEYRLSNYLLWQIAYTELYFTSIYWPEFREKNFYEAIIDFQKRERRFGKVSNQ